MWLSNAHTEEFRLLPVAKLKNKVVCQEHFTDDCFMNARHDSLKKNAIPTESPKEKRIPAVIKKSIAKKQLPVVVHLDPHEFTWDDQNIQVSTTPQLPQTNSVKIINGTLPVPIDVNSLHDVSPHPMDEFTEEGPQTESMIDADVSGVSNDEISKQIQHCANKLDEQREIMILQGNTIDQLKGIMQERLLNQACQEKKEQPLETKTSSTNMNKRNLFNAMRRHINPVMATLLGMELFGSADHEWMDEEKELAVDLFAQGEAVYKYFRDELRFRLPAIADVDSWWKERRT